MMFSLTILLYALVSNTFIGYLLQKDNKRKTKTKQLIKIRPSSQINYVGNVNCVSDDTPHLSLPKLDICKPNDTETDYKALASFVNTGAKLFFAFAVLLFNAGFWAYSISKYIELFP